MKTVTRTLLVGMGFFLICCSASAHHGVASLGTAGLKGPGAPIETSSSATLPQHSLLAYVKLDYASFESFTAATDDEGDYAAYWMYGLGYGINSWVSLYTFLPFYTKRPEDNSYTTSGFADASIMAVLGFKIDEGIRRVPASESLDDLEDVHFTLYGGGTLPTGDANTRDADGAIDPGMSLGFGKPSISGGLAVTKQLTSRVTGVFETSVIQFQEYEYDDGQRVRFGNEFRINAALPMRLALAPARGLRLDACLEGNYLSLGRDEENGVGAIATGGQILYLVPGLRFFMKHTSLGLGVKFPVWTDLNEDEIQQGAEGKERFRTVVTFSTLF